MDYALQSYRGLLAVPWPDIMALGRVNPADANEPFCMTVLALKAFPRRERRQRTARRSQPRDVAVPLPGPAG